MEIEKQLKMYFKQQTEGLEVDVTAQVMERLGQSTKKPSKQRLILLIAVISIFIISTGFTFGGEIIDFIKDMSFSNDQGEVEWSIQTTTDEWDHRDLINDTLESLNLAEGEAVAIYVKENNVDHSVNSYVKPIYVDAYEEMVAYSLNNLTVIPLPETLLECYQFGKGAIQKDCESPDIEALLDEAQSSEEPVFVKPLKTLPEISNIQWEYYRDNVIDETPELQVNIMTWVGNELILTEEETNSISTSERWMVAQSEVLYIEKADYREVIWIQDAVYYAVRFTDAEMTKDDILSVVEEIKIP